jgi:ABC-type polysaccharide/polyol phosphate export permease
VVVVLMIFLPQQDFGTFLLAIPALLLVFVALSWITLLVALLSARFRDVPQIVANLLQLMFFLTPIIWHPTLLGGRNRVVFLNPLYHMVEIIRAPLLGKIPAAGTWWTLAVMGAIGWAVTLVLYRQYRRRIAYWI